MAVPVAYLFRVPVCPKCSLARACPSAARTAPRPAGLPQATHRPGAIPPTRPTTTREFPSGTEPTNEAKRRASGRLCSTELHHHRGHDQQMRRLRAPLSLIGMPEQLFTKQGPAFRWGLVGWTLPGHAPARHRDSEIFAAQAGEFATTRRQTGTVRAPPINNLFRPALLRPHWFAWPRYIANGWRTIVAILQQDRLFLHRNRAFRFTSCATCASLLPPGWGAFYKH